MADLPANVVKRVLKELNELVETPCEGTYDIFACLV